MPAPDERPLVVLPPLTPLQQGLPLGGLTVLVVEDSRFAADALRLMCQHSGARLRRAETLEAARRHLSLYTPDVMIVDIGLPDGSGLDLIAEVAEPRAAAATDKPTLAQTSACARRLAQDLSAVEDDDRRAQLFHAAQVLRAAMVGTPPDVAVPPVFAMSGALDVRDAALAAGARDFLAKPLPDLETFQSMVLASVGDRHLRPPVFGGPIAPDPMAMIDDLRIARSALDQAPDGTAEGWLWGFLAGLASLAQDQALSDALASGDGVALRRVLSEKINAAVAFAPRPEQLALGAGGEAAQGPAPDGCD